MTYPKTKYHPEHPEGVIVKDLEAELQLGEGWVDHPHELPIEILSRQPYWPNEPVDPPAAEATPEPASKPKRGGRSRSSEVA